MDGKTIVKIYTVYHVYKLVIFIWPTCWVLRQGSTEKPDQWIAENNQSRFNSDHEHSLVSKGSE